jgi:ankyrin repeat protein
MKRFLLSLIMIVAVGSQAVASVSGHSQADLNTRLTRATEAGDYTEMRRLLNLGADANYKRTNAFRYPLLLIAALRGHARAVEILLKHGANPEATDLRGTPILVSAAALSSDTSDRLNEAIAMLLARGRANPNARDRAAIGDGRSALHLAAANGDEELVEMLLAAGANPNVQNRVGETPLHFAAAHGNIETVRILIAHGAFLNARSRYTRITPVMAAAESGYADVVELLIQRRADIFSKNTFGDTPLTMARTTARRAHDPELEDRIRETIRLLESAGDQS